MDTNKSSLKETVYAHIKNDILNQQLKPGTILNERKLSESLNVSRTPVREALKTLEAEYLVEYIPYKGVIVKSMNPGDLKHIFQIRGALEILSVQLAFDKMNNETVRKLDAAVKRQEDIIPRARHNLSEFIELDLDFHDIIVNITGNTMLRQFILELREKTKILGINALHIGGHRFYETIEEHRSIVTAFKHNDFEELTQAMRLHIDNTYRNAKAYLKSLP